jgi:hypothetical protein
VQARTWELDGRQHTIDEVFRAHALSKPRNCRIPSTAGEYESLAELAQMIRRQGGQMQGEWRVDPTFGWRSADGHTHLSFKKLIAHLAWRNLAPECEPIDEVMAEGDEALKPEQEQEPTPEPEPDPDPEPVTEPEPEPVPAPEPEPVSAPEPEPKGMDVETSPELVELRIQRVLVDRMQAQVKLIHLREQRVWSYPELIRVTVEELISRDANGRRALPATSRRVRALVKTPEGERIFRAKTSAEACAKVQGAGITQVSHMIIYAISYDADGWLTIAFVEWNAFFRPTRVPQVIDAVAERSPPHAVFPLPAAWNVCKVD